jgi:hypothetical protein
MATTAQAVPKGSAIANYWDDNNLHLYFNTSSDFSLDINGAKKYKKQATAPGEFVTQLQNHLIELNYLGGTSDGYFGKKTKRAVLRFQRHSHRVYRMKKSGHAADVKKISFTGAVNGTCDYTTAQEIQNWLKNSWVLPLGRFKFVSIGNGKLRSDAAMAFNTTKSYIKSKGGTLDGPYGDTTRSAAFRKHTGGNSLYSLHYTGRAVDLQQALAGGRKQRYFVVREIAGGDTYWRIYCKTDRQDGTQGSKISKLKKIKYYSFFDKKEYQLPEAYYVDITNILNKNGFARIKSHSNWKINSKGLEWWHFHYEKDLQKTFQDEMELVGYSEEVLRNNGWKTDAQLDHKPG